MARFVVTGGVGFIGYHLCSALAARGDDVLIVDDFSDAPYPRAEKARNQHDLEAEHGARVRVVTACVTDRAALTPLISKGDVVVHLAGLAGVRPSFRDPARYARVNVEGTAVVLRVARASGAARFLFASSSSVYGDATPLPASEDAPAIAPESPYGASKRAAELVASAIVREHTPDIPCTALRFFTVYGARQRPEMAVTLFMRAVLAAAPITVFGDGSMRRDFTHVSDITAGVLAAIEKAPPAYRVYNLGSGAPVRLSALVSAIERVAGRRPVVERAPVPRGDVEATFADISRAREELGWAPRVTLDEGLETVRAWVSQT